MAGSWKKLLFSDDILQIRKNTGAYLTARQKLNFIEGTNVTMTVADDNDEIDVTINSSGGGGGTFDVDLVGDLEPSETVNSDTYFEADVNSDLEPKEA